MMTAADHIEFTKTRALEALDSPEGGVDYAIRSVQSDLLNHPDTRGHDAIVLIQMLAMQGHMNTEAQVREFIDGIR